MARLVLHLFLLQLVFVAIVSGFFLSKKLKNPTKYKLKQKVLTLGSSYTVTDDHGQAVYKVRLHRELSITIFPSRLDLNK